MWILLLLATTTWLLDDVHAKETNVLFIDDKGDFVGVNRCLQAMYSVEKLGRDKGLTRKELVEDVRKLCNEEYAQIKEEKEDGTATATGGGEGDVEEGGKDDHSVEAVVRVAPVRAAAEHDQL